MITFEVESDGGYFISRWQGPLRGDEMIPTYREFLDSGLWHPQLGELGDISKGDFSRVTSDELARLAEWMSAAYSKRGATDVPVAVYAPHDLPYGLARLYGSWAEGSPEVLQIFRDYDAAVSWLEQRRPR